ncbi:MAG: DinB family protein [Flavobacteriales bacterium]|nr:DinB family protein [Flavobacteriales bacterium]
MQDERLFVKMALDAWNTQLKGTSALIDELTDAQLMQEVAPGRNRGIYLLGHLAAEHDLMLPLLRFQDPLFPELKPVFVDAADRDMPDVHTVAQLRARWAAVSTALNARIMKLPAAEWFTRHANISAEDFPKEPHRNRLNVLLSRTIHLAHHRGQLVLLSSK